MLKARSRTANGEPLSIIGLSEQNVRRLKAGEPIVFNGAVFGIDGQVAILYGASESSIAEEMGIQIGQQKKPGEA